MPKVRVHNLAISLDGCAAGPDQSRDNTLGVGGTRPHEWVEDALGRAIEAAFGRALEAAGGADVRIGGGLAAYECVEFVSSPRVAHARLALTSK